MKKFVLFFLIAFCSIFAFTACTKDEILDHYNQVLQKVGDNNLAKDSKLQGQRTFGEDSYVGSYFADYEDFTGTETLFGGTALERGDGNEIEIICKLNITNGTGKLVLQSGTDGLQTLTESTGDYSKTIELPSASNYIIVDGNNFTGSIQLEIK
ncbi:hypothetical protein BD780_003356 [Clostridium tetanomorphum]|uniref:Lipoprotein n=1 Tax=Clostridium tetanomorphum TaxID=1553 RepID=A0A923ED14_CLOTT|nr:hypothetical protein [Clostridium tetanomorphum]KAJ51688.1 hypothetical protein CTM_11315 [Clostridium tetanomorphum DSM 665]MBC2399136.1 hypothetical protein [Clostridium tetanomorphum]MBP1865950.1 hypothetical protein [Clostridium tetanomorphum]NRS86131.1 hypothetical protein [Clostridium tetanomorphum]NRZ95848.1 hypothetical protein [Clostridium tetanomorphum]